MNIEQILHEFPSKIWFAIGIYLQ